MINTVDQQRAFDKLSKLKVGALFMKQGTGKTKVALDLMSFKANKVDLFLWICPCSLKEEFLSQKNKWAPQLDVMVVGCESIGSSGRIYLELLEFVKGKKVFIVVDESLKIKNQTALRTERIIHLGETATYKLVLNGTPMSKSVLDIYTQMEFLSPKILHTTFSDFKNTYCEYYLRGNMKGKVKKNVNIPHLISIIEPYIFDADLDINVRKNFKNVIYEIQDKEEYESLKFNYLINHYDTSDTFFYSIATICQQYYCSYKNRGKFLERTILENTPCIVFVKYLSSIPEDAHCIIGETKNRQEIIEEFKNGKFDVLYMTYGVGAFGLNLQFCKNMIFADHTFDYAMREQAEARIYRTGQIHDCNYVNLVCNCGLEKMIRNSLDNKQVLLQTMKESIMESKTGWETFIKNL